MGLGEAIWAVSVPMVRLQVIMTGAGKRGPGEGRIEAAPARNRKHSFDAEGAGDQCQGCGPTTVNEVRAATIASRLIHPVGRTPEATMSAVLALRPRQSR